MTPAPKTFGNGIANESPDLGSTTALKSTCVPTSLRRNADGSWTVVLDADYRFVLPDGREIRCIGELRIKGRQYGRKPREAS